MRQKVGEHSSPVKVARKKRKELKAEIGQNILHRIGILANLTFHKSLSESRKDAVMGGLVAIV
jgi:hypothetical protein